MLQPTFSKEQIRELDKSGKVSRALNGTAYIPGNFLGKNMLEIQHYEICLKLTTK